MGRTLLRFREFGGFRLIREYARMGLLPLCFKQVMAVLSRRKKAMEAYGSILERVGGFLRSKYEPVLNDIDQGNSMKMEGKHSRYVWICWLQGMENAPNLVQVCYKSIQQHLQDRDVVLLTEEKIGQYVSLPDYIVKKYKEGIIPTAHYTDLLRLELLVRYGGTWIDATVLCTGFESLNGHEFKEVFDADLFLFQQLRKGETRYLGISNWFISSCSDNWVLKELRDLLFRYWKDYDCVVHYYMFHLFFGMIMEKHPEEAVKMPRYGNRPPHYLSRRMGDKYDEAWMTELKEHCCFHKLNYRLGDKVLESKDTFYDVIINKNKFGIN